MLKPIRDLKAAIAARTTPLSNPSDSSSGAPPQPSSSAQSHDPSSAVAAPFQLVAATPGNMTPSSGKRGRARPQEIQEMQEESDEDVPLAHQRGSSGMKPAGQAIATSGTLSSHTRPPPTFNGQVPILRSNAAPKLQPTPPTSPARGQTPPPPVQMAVEDDLESLPVEIFSPVPSPSRLPRPEAPVAQKAQQALSSPALAGPGPSTQASQRLRAQPPPSPPKPQRIYPWSKEVEQKLRQVFGLPKFRHHQKEAIDVTMAGEDGELTSPYAVPRTDS